MITTSDIQSRDEFAVVERDGEPACRVNLLLMEDVMEAEPCTP